MRNAAIAIVLSLGLATAPAWAAQPQTQDKAQGGGDQTLMPKGGDNQGDAQDGSNAGLQSQDALKQSLQKAGFSDLQIAAGSYVVHAKSPDGKPVVMMITPDSVAVAKPQSAELPDLNQNGRDQSRSGSQDQDTPQLPQNE